MKKYFLAKKGNALSIAGTSLFLCARSLFYAVAKQSKFVKTTNFFANFSASFFPSVFRRRRISVPGIRTHKKRQPDETELPKNMEKFFVKLRDGKPCQKSTAAGVSGGSGNFLRNGRELVKVGDGERQVARLEELGQHLRHQVMTLEISRLFADVLTSDDS